MTDLSPRPQRRSGHPAPKPTAAAPGRPTSGTGASRRNPAVLRGAAVVLVIGIAIFGWAVARHRVEAAYADRGVTTVGTVTSSGSLLGGTDVIFADGQGVFYRVSYIGLGGPKLGPSNGRVPLEYLADDPLVVRYDTSRLPVAGYYLLAATVLSFGLLGLYVGTYHGVPLTAAPNGPTQ